MAFMMCPSCQAQIDVTDLAQGTKITCAECSASVVVSRQTALIDEGDALAAIARARDKLKAETKTSLKCPNCDTEMQIRQADHVPGATFRCIECGQKILMASKPGAKGSDTVSFPTLGSEGTLLDMGDTRQVWKKDQKRDTKDERR
jgi:DNA-directed RNA polymerase subunit RPC12/RpoP